MKDDRVYLQHILDCINRIEENIAKGNSTPYPLAKNRSVPEHFGS